MVPAVMILLCFIVSTSTAIRKILDILHFGIVKQDIYITFNFYMTFKIQ